MGGWGGGRAEPSLVHDVFLAAREAFYLFFTESLQTRLEFQVGGWGCGSQIERLSRGWEGPGSTSRPVHRRRRRLWRAADG